MRIAESKDNFWTSYRDWTGTGFRPDRPTAGHDCELHATAAILSTGPVGLGDYIGMTNATLVQRLARTDGILLRPDRPLAPMDVLVSGLVGVRGLANGARLWTTHASVAAEDPACPELVTTPTRRLVCHTGVDATRVTTVPAALNGLAAYLMQWIVMSVDVASSFPVLVQDLYPSPLQLTPAPALLYVRSWHQAQCINGSDAIASGCVSQVNLTSLGSSTALFDARTDLANATSCEHCDHRFTLWQMYPSSGVAGEVIVLGDLEKTVPLSGYRFRLLAGRKDTLVVVGAPGEKVAITCLVRSSVGGQLAVHVVDVVLPASGRVTAALPTAPGHWWHFVARHGLLVCL